MTYFEYPNDPRSWGVRITEGLLYTENQMVNTLLKMFFSIHKAGLRRELFLAKKTTLTSDVIWFYVADAQGSI